MSAKFVENTVIELINGQIVMSRSDLAMPPFSIDPKNWNEIKDAVDELLPVKPKLTLKEEIEEMKLSEPELAEKMISVGLEITYARNRICHMWWSRKGYSMTLVDYEPYSKDEKRFDNSDDFKTEFLKLKPRNTNRDWEKDFDDFMRSVVETKEYYNVTDSEFGGDDE